MQDGPPPGGFPSVRIARRIPSTGPGGFTVFAVSSAIMAYGFYLVRDSCVEVDCCTNLLLQLFTLLLDSLLALANDSLHNGRLSRCHRWGRRTMSGAPSGKKSRWRGSRWCPSCRPKRTGGARPLICLDVLQHNACMQHDAQQLRPPAHD